MPEQATAGTENCSCAMSDLNRLRGPGGRERTEAEYCKLAAAAGFTFVATTDIGMFSLVKFRNGEN